MPCQYIIAQWLTCLTEIRYELPEAQAKIFNFCSNYQLLSVAIPYWTLAEVTLLAISKMRHRCPDQKGLASGESSRPGIQNK